VRTLRDPIVKVMLRNVWRVVLLAHTLLFSRKKQQTTPYVFYGGARGGSVGGPLVKIKRLQEYFPQYAFKYNLVYALSNAPYLPSMAVDWLKHKNIPIVLNQNGVFYPGWYSGDYRKKNAIMADLYHRAEYVFWQSEFCRRSADRFLGTRKGLGEVLFNAVDLKHFSPLRGTPDRPFNFLLTGKINRSLNYRVETAIAGLALARDAGMDVELTISGWLEDPNEVQVMAKSHGISRHVKITGSYSQDEAPFVYQASHAYIMTKHLDPCPNTVIEALACGLPVLYSSSGGVPELVGEDAGIGLKVPEDWERVRVPDPAAIATGMSQIVANHGTMSQAARKRAIDHFDIREWTHRHHAVFKQLLMRQT
jgi:glycosyltransferase involved in cell wall biosynthesis